MIEISKRKAHKPLVCGELLSWWLLPGDDLVGFQVDSYIVVMHKDDAAKIINGWKRQATELENGVDMSLRF